MSQTVPGTIHFVLGFFPSGVGAIFSYNILISNMKSLFDLR